MGHTLRMFEIIQSETFQGWLSGLKDRQAVARIHARLDRRWRQSWRCEAVRDGVAEMRVDHGAGSTACISFAMGRW